ncbi:response regulator transcription factor [Amycolatopsis sp. EV170708-02-1]|uniref:response regulator transcription factor n=1 Tax=Amycolatopsis sp. EV170708-02-1 TaxID=2919322 RepID=UPI001F0BECDC|nr:response regulator transcription factor [Amycolatopsis sp. EV170708-02-1]UMP06976.1 response regulator transcription factor [Amycolatopsis sp. EV170708-02-1]
MTPVNVLVQAEDAVSRLGTVDLLTQSPYLEIIDEDRLSDVQVVVLVATKISCLDLESLRRIRAEGNPAQLSGSVVVSDNLEPALAMTAVDCGVVSVLPRATITADRLGAAVVGATNGLAYLPDRLQRAFLEQLSDLRRGVLEPNGLSFAGLTQREIDVLRLVAEGRPTDQIGAELAYSVGTVKNVLSGLCERFGLRNRSEAVAYAIKAGVL